MISRGMDKLIICILYAVFNFGGRLYRRPRDMEAPKCGPVDGAPLAEVSDRRCTGSRKITNQSTSEIEVTRQVQLYK